MRSFGFFIQVLVNKTPEQCRDHFERVYVENASGEFADDWNLGEENSAAERRLVTSLKLPVGAPNEYQLRKFCSNYRVTCMVVE